MLLREGRAEDLPLVLDSWVKSYAGSKFAESIRAAGVSYERFQDLVAKNILGRSSTQLRVAVWDQDGDDTDAPIVGWSATEGSVVHYVWVRPQWRGDGLSKTLLGEQTYTAATHKTRALPAGIRLDWMRVWA